MRLPSTERTWPGSNGSIMRCSCAMRRIHLSLLMLMAPCPWSRAVCAWAAGGIERRLVVRSNDRPGGPARVPLVILDDDFRKYGGPVLRLLRDARGDLAGDVAVDRGDRPFRIGDDRGLARIGLLADPDVEREAPEHLHVVVLRHLLRPAGAEDMLRVAAMGADVDRHVLDHAEDRDADLLEHLEALARI